MSSVGVGNSLVRTGLDAQGVVVEGLHKLPLKNENNHFASQGCPVPPAALLLATQGVCSNGEKDQVHIVYGPQQVNKCVQCSLDKNFAIPSATVLQQTTCIANCLHLLDGHSAM